MRKSLMMVGIPVSVLGLGLAGFMAMRSMNKPANDDFANELAKADAAGIELAQAQAAKRFALNETAPQAKPESKTVTKRGNGTKAVRSNTPTVKAAPEPVVADVVEELPEATAMSQSPAPAPVVTTVAVNPAPAPSTTPAPAQDQGPILRGGSGAGGSQAGSGGSGGGWGVFGAVIRGGVVDGDNCDPRGARARTPRTGPVYGGNPNAGRTPVATGGSVIRGGGITLPIGVTTRSRGGR